MAETTELSRRVQEFVARESQAGSVDSWVDGIATAVLAQSPEVADDAALAQAVHAAVRAHWVAFLNSLGEPPREVHLVQAAIDLASELAHRGHELTLLFRVYRIAQQAVWDYIASNVGRAGEQSQDDARFLVLFWSRASAWLDASIEASVGVFQTERDRIRQGAAAQRLDAVRAILAGSDKEPRELSAMLGGHPLSSYNTALLLHVEHVEHIADLRESANRVARAVGAKNPLIVSPGGRDLWCWLATRSAPDLSRVHGCASWLAEAGMSVAVGTPLAGIDGFRVSHQEAQQAQKVAFRAASIRSVALYSEVELLCLLAESGEETRRFVLRTLGDLAGEGEGPARLRQTLHALLSTGSVDGASKLLMVHKNTVRYRVNQAEELLGHPAGRAPTELELALRYYDAFLAPPTGG
ncbi:PucR family transcriptional regulator [Nocardioides limicola]|uniref:PucR family transcriptional regulator n=1 Tax=Nocardioides limicola TaxID=2803368 RepID=UPI00193B9DBA|nr:helix-turn-helix domain-containing protein [Nocardioides sp. DJM-14]